MDERKLATMTEVLSDSVECQVLSVVADWDGAQTSSEGLDMSLDSTWLLSRTHEESAAPLPAKALKMYHSSLYTYHLSWEGGQRLSARCDPFLRSLDPPHDIPAAPPSPRPTPSPS